MKADKKQDDHMIINGCLAPDIYDVTRFRSDGQVIREIAIAGDANDGVSEMWEQCKDAPEDRVVFHHSSKSRSHCGGFPKAFHEAYDRTFGKKPEPEDMLN